MKNSTDTKAIFDQLIHLQENGRHQEATRLCFSSLTKQPESQELLGFFINLLEDSEHFSQDQIHQNFFSAGQRFSSPSQWQIAATFFEKAISISPDIPEPYLNLASLYLQHTEIQKAYQTLLFCIKNSIQSVDFYNLLKKIIKQLDVDEQINFFEKEILKQPQNFGFRASLGDLLTLKEDHESAYHHFEIAAQILPEAHWIKIRMRNCMRVIGDFEKSLHLQKYLCDHYPDIPQPLFDLAQLLIDNDQEKEALKVLEKLTTNFPEVTDAFTKKVNVLVSLNQLEKAKKISKSFIDHNPQNLNGFINLAKIYELEYNWDLALEIYIKARELNPDHLSIILGYANALFQLQHFEEAKHLYQNFLNTQPHRHQGLEGLAKIARVCGYPQLALEYSKKLIQNFPEMAAGYNECMINLIELNRHKEANEYFLKRPAQIKNNQNKPLTIFPDKFKLPDIIGENNNYSFIENDLLKFKHENHPYVLPVSVLLPVYNRSKLLAKTLACILQQSYPQDLIEVIVVDDGSHDDVMKVIKNYESKLDLIYCRQSDKGYRLSAARNHGIKIAKHDYIISLDCDVYPIPNFIEDMMAYFHVSDKILLMGLREYISSGSITEKEILKDKDALSKTPRFKENDQVKLDWRIPFYESSNNLKNHQWPFKYFTGGISAFPKKMIEHTGLYDESFNHWGREDGEFALRAFNEGYYFIPVNSSIGLHEEPENGENETDREAGAEITQKLYIQKCPVHTKRNPLSDCNYEVPMVSIYIPAYNAAEYIKECVDSVLKQTYRDLEVCICNDGSTDNTLDILEKNYHNHPKVKWITQENQGIGKASNSALKMCKGVYIGQLDSDDLLKPNAVEVSVRHLEKLNIGGVYSAYDVIDKDGNWIREGYCETVFTRETMLKGMSISHFRMFRKADWKRTTGFDEKLTNAVDYDMFLKLCEICQFTHIPEILYSYRWHGENTSVKKLKIQTRNHFLVINKSLERMGLSKDWEAVPAKIDTLRDVKIIQKDKQSVHTLPIERSPLPMNLEEANCVFILAQPRSGSTLLLRLLNTLDGFNICGENRAAFSSLAQFYESMLYTLKMGPKDKSSLSDSFLSFDALKQRQVYNPNYSGFEWYNVFNDKEVFQKIRELIIEILNPKMKYETFGFKEIRYGRSETEHLETEINILKTLFPKAKFVFNTREIEDILKSAWLKDQNPTFAQNNLLRQANSFKRYAENNPDHSFHITYKDVLDKSQTLLDLYTFLNRPFSLDDYKKTLAR